MKILLELKLLFILFKQVQCKQKFTTMDLGLRTEVGALFEEKSEKYGLEDITYGSFSANFGFRHKFGAADVVYACLALMEQHLESNNCELSFFISLSLSSFPTFFSLTHTHPHPHTKKTFPTGSPFYRFVACCKLNSTRTLLRVFKDLNMARKSPLYSLLL